MVSEPLFSARKRSDAERARERDEKKLNYVKESNDSNVSEGCYSKGVSV